MATGIEYSVIIFRPYGIRLTVLLSLRLSLRIIQHPFETGIIDCSLILAGSIGVFPPFWRSHCNLYAVFYQVIIRRGKFLHPEAGFNISAHWFRKKLLTISTFLLLGTARAYSLHEKSQCYQSQECYHIIDLRFHIFVLYKARLIQALGPRTWLTHLM